MELFTIMIIIMCGLFAIMCIIGGIALYRINLKGKTRVNILLKDRKWYRKKYKNVPSEINILGKTYVFDDKALIHGKWVKDIYYFEDSPLPMYFDVKNYEIGLLSKDLHNLLESDLVEKLFASDDIDLIKLLVIIALFLIVIAIALSAFGAFGSCTLKANKKNIDLITIAVKQAIKGV